MTPAHASKGVSESVRRAADNEPWRTNRETAPTDYQEAAQNGAIPITLSILLISGRNPPLVATRVLSRSVLVGDLLRLGLGSCPATR